MANMKLKRECVSLGIVALLTFSAGLAGEADVGRQDLGSQNLMSIDQNKNEAAIRELIDGFVNAIRAKDINGVMAVFAPEVVSFDLGPPLRHGGGQAFTERWQELFVAYPSAIHYEVSDLSVTAGDDVAFSHSLNRISGTLKDGRTSERWLRWTACYRKVNGRWLIVHEQVSVPVDVRSGKGLLDLKP